MKPIEITDEKNIISILRGGALDFVTFYCVGWLKICKYFKSENFHLIQLKLQKNYQKGCHKTFKRLLITTKVDHKLRSSEDCWRFGFHLPVGFFLRWDIIIMEKSFS